MKYPIAAKPPIRLEPKQPMSEDDLIILFLIVGVAIAIGIGQGICFAFHAGGKVHLAVGMASAYGFVGFILILGLRARMQRLDREDRQLQNIADVAGFSEACRDGGHTLCTEGGCPCFCHKVAEQKP